ncbi:DUF4329 domain-containing protein [Pseudomonas sp. SDO528_S397]
MAEKISAQTLSSSPAFIQSDDAARYAHERIGARRQVEFGSVILQRSSDRLFVASEPVAGNATSFDWTLLLDRAGPAGDFIDPPGYRIVASLHSHPDAQASTRNNNPKWTPQQARTFVSFFSEPDIDLNYTERARFSAAYLSGPDGALLKYQPSGSPAEAGFVRWMATQGTWDSPHSHDGSLEGFYKKLAAVGQLSFLQSSPAWGGSVGKVPTDWQPYQPFSAPRLPLACGPVFSDRQRALDHAWSRIQRRPSQRQHVLLLQHDTRPQFVASEPLLAGDPDKPLPAGFHLHGIYLHSRPLPGLYPALEAWLYKNFISPLELAERIAHFRQYSQGPHSTLGASLYVRLRDEALLRYRFSGSAEESRLFTRGEGGQVQDNGTQASLLAGRLLTRDFVRQVAKAGELSVEKTSALWDRPGGVDEHWQPYANVALPALSRAFLRADDAAQYAHQRLGERRDQTFGGLVLETENGRFHITEPLPCDARPFAFAAGYPKDRQGEPIILHAGLRLHGRYGSRVALAQESEANAQLFSNLDVADVQASGRVGYLSGAVDSLIAWQTRDRVLPPPGSVSELARHGTLRVVVASPLWGPVGGVEPDWKPYERILQYQRPEPVTHGAVFASADAAARDLHRRVPQSFGERYLVHFFGFVLKHDSADDYVASELIPFTRGSPLLVLSALYGDSLPDGFHCHALYYSRQWPGFGLNTGLERFFVRPEHLDLALAQARINASQAPLGAPLYMAPPEGALLCYQSPSTAAMFEAQSSGDAADVVQAKLDSGTLEPVQFVRLLAVSGHLRVIVPSDCWDRPGEVSGLWNAYEHVQRRELGPVFLSMDDAARSVRERVRGDATQVYGGVILRRDDEGYVATTPVRMSDEVFDLQRLFPDALVIRGLYPVRTSVVAYYHSRPLQQWPFLRAPLQAQVYNGMFSTRALAHAVSADQTPLHHYLLGPDGSLLRLLAAPHLKYPPLSRADLVLRPGNRHDWVSGALERRLRRGELTPVEYVNQVAAAYDLRVVVGSALWGAQGRVSGWVPASAPAVEPGRYVRARHDPACSPLFTRADDAARHVHEWPGARVHVTFGHVLVAAQGGQFVATLPVAEGGSSFAHRRVFSDAGYPYRHTLSALYLRLPERADFHPTGRAQTGDAIFRGLCAPTHLIELLHQTHATQLHAARPLYVSCADGALLKFVVRDPRFVTYADELKLRTRLLSPTDYIRRMAAAGELHILLPSEHWPGAGRVDAQWQPGRSRGADEPSVLLAPVHGHPEDAVAFAHARAGRFDGRQYAGALLENPTSNRYLTVLPMVDEGFPSSVTRRLFGNLPWPTGYRLCAAHLLFHAGLDQPSNPTQNDFRRFFVAWPELGFYLHELRRQRPDLHSVYLSVRDGALLGYLPRFSDEEYNLLAVTGKWSAEGGYTGFAPLPSWFISQLARIGELRVIRTGDFWTVAGRLGEHLAASISPSPQTPAKDEL